MPDPLELTRQAAELTVEAERHPDAEIRVRLLRTDKAYARIAEHENWLAAHRDLTGLFADGQR